MSGLLGQEDYETKHIPISSLISAISGVICLFDDLCERNGLQCCLVALVNCCSGHVSKQLIILKKIDIS